MSRGLTWTKLLWGQIVIGAIVGYGFYSINKNLENSCKKVVVADFNNDGLADLVTLTCDKEPKIEIYVNKGNNEFFIYLPKINTKRFDGRNLSDMDELQKLYKK